MQEIILEKIINKLATDNVVDLSILNDKTIVLSLIDINLDICFYINNNQIFIFDEVKENDAHISIKFSVFLALINNTSLDDLIRDEKVIINGEVKTAQLLIDVLKNNTIKDKIKQILPNSINDKISKFKQDLKSKNFKDEIINLLIRPKIYK